MTTLALNNVSITASGDSVADFPGVELRELRFKLAYELQSSLELIATLQTFFTSIQDVVKVSGLLYFAPGKPQPLKVGTPRTQRVTYAIRAEQEDLGEIVFTRNQYFMEPELAALEMLIGVLFYPLRNALLYQQALLNSLRDMLTGIGNRAALEISFEREFKLSQRHKQALSLLVVDIDHFKRINDEFGHATGDEVLKHIAQILQQGLRETDQVFRFGGEEFVVLLSNTNLDNARLTAERLRQKIATSPLVQGEHTLQAQASIGVSEMCQEDSTTTLFQRADKALYCAKRNGRNRVETGCDYATA